MLYNLTYFWIKYFLEAFDLKYSASFLTKYKFVPYIFMATWEHQILLK